MRSFNERVTSDDLMDGSVTTAKLAAGAGAGNIGAGAITAVMLAAGSAASNVGTGGVTAAMLSSGALAAAGAAAPATPALAAITGLGAIPVWVKYTLSAAAVAALGASLTGTLSPAALVLPANTVIHDAVINVTVAFSGASISALHVNIGDTGTATSMYTAVDLTTVAAAGVDLVLPYTAANQVKLAFTAVGANLSAVAAGSATLYLLCSALD